MSEPNATVNPFDFAGVQLPTQGIGQDCGVNDPLGLGAPYTLPGSAGGLLPRSDVDLTPIEVVVPFVADGDILQVTVVVPVAAGGGGATGFTCAPVLVWVSEAGPTLAAILLEGICSTEFATGPGEIGGTTAQAWYTVIGDSTLSAGAYPVNGGPVTVQIAYILDASALTGGLLGVPTLRVQRIPRQRLYGSPPPQNLIFI